MAALLWYHRRLVLNSDANASYCIVFEPRTKLVFTPGSNPSRQVRTVTTACEVVAALWPTIKP